MINSFLFSIILMGGTSASAAPSFLSRLLHGSSMERSIATPQLPGRVWVGDGPEVLEAEERVMQVVHQAQLDAQALAQVPGAEQAGYLLKGDFGFTSRSRWDEPSKWVLELHKSEISSVFGAQHREAKLAFVSWIRFQSSGTSGRSGFALLDLTGNLEPWIIDSASFPMKYWGREYIPLQPLVSADGRYFIFGTKVFRVERESNSLQARPLYDWSARLKEIFPEGFSYAMYAAQEGRVLVFNMEGEEKRAYAWLNIETGAVISRHSLSLSGWSIVDVVDRADEPTFLVRELATGKRLRLYREGQLLSPVFEGSFPLEQIRLSPTGRYALLAPLAHIQTPIQVLDVRAMQAIGRVRGGFPRVDPAAVALSASGFWGSEEEYFFLSAPTVVRSGVGDNFDVFLTAGIDACQKQFENREELKRLTAEVEE